MREQKNGGVRFWPSMYCVCDGMYCGQSDFATEKFLPGLPLPSLLSLHERRSSGAIAGKLFVALCILPSEGILSKSRIGGVVIRNRGPIIFPERNSVGRLLRGAVSSPSVSDESYSGDVQAHRTLCQT